MASATRHRPGLVTPGARRPAFIAHGGGNTPELARGALQARADYLEVDLWLHNRQFEARHERRFPFHFPVFYEKWYMRRAPRRPFRLPDVLSCSCPGAGVFLDLKNGGVEAARLVAEAVAGAPPACPVAASSQVWGLLRPLAAAAPEVSLFYSIDVQAKLDLFLSVSLRDHAPHGVSCRHTLLTRAVIGALHERGLDVVAWTVDDETRAAELIAMGVDAITTHRVAELRASLGLE